MPEVNLPDDTIASIDKINEAVRALLAQPVGAPRRHEVIRRLARNLAWAIDEAVDGHDLADALGAARHYF